jgi:NAD(P)-dependent dehydrogenase (short-subunit alcohol dehydrogenase family)
MKILVTGASRGIGRAIAERAVAEGWTVKGTSRRPDEITDEHMPPGVTFHRLDLTDPRSIECLASSVGEVDVLVNNAGLSQIGSAEEATAEQIRYLFDLNVIGAIRLTQLMLPGMRAKGTGTIVNITSMADTIAVPFSSLYAATKHALAGFTRGLRNEVRSFGIRVIRVVPIYIRTDLPQQATSGEESPYSSMVKRIKETRDRRFERGTEPEDVAELVVRILRTPKPRLSYYIGRSARLFTILNGWLPEGWIDALVRMGSGLSRNRYSSL